MARPTLTDVEHGQQSWDATINDNNDVITGGPFPLKQYANFAALPAAGADNVDCLAVTEDTDELWISDGTNWRHYGPGHVNLNGARGLLKTDTTLLSALSGATATWTNAFPAGAIRLGVAGRVTTLITGATSFDVGDGSDQDRYANDKAVALNTTFTPADGTATPLEWAAAASNVVLTANGSNFTGGAVRLVAYYLQLTAPTS
jgi:hypothetical protein